MNPAISTAVSGVQVHSKRFAASAHNVANMTVVVPGDGLEQQVGPFSVDPVSAVDGGVRGQTRFLSPAYVPAHDPDHPLADANGTVGQVNVSLEQETVRQIEAQRAYEANLAVIKVGDSMLGALLDQSS
ncbi:flagellar basal body rod protein FlgC [Algihabitans albus]|uniref:flagellar basal body rod protein FlgC n=1 Tax=Algihabitans albus TaxID=2164067 RepID=UPI000E5D10A5|nr:flagellar basal body rod C-terminal domain-containing protein [Algihabitans albus]